MFSYTKEQKVNDMLGKKVGGLPGENPTMMLGSVFYEGQFEEPKASRSEAVELINKQEEFSKELALNSMIDIFIYEKSEIEWKVNFALDNIDGFFSLDMPEASVRIDTLKYLEEQDGLERTIYNSLNLGVTEEELKALKECTPASAIILGYNPMNNNTQGRLDMIRTGGTLLDKGLLDMAKEIGIEHFLLDTAATPFGEGASESLRAVPVFKSEFGLPVGCAMHNTLESWLWFNDYKGKSEVSTTLDAAIDVLPVILGADFVHYGPADNYREEFLTIAMVDKLIAEGAESYFGTEIGQYHPYRKL